MSAFAEQLRRTGYVRFPFSRELEDWAAELRPHAVALAADPDLRAKWLRHGGTWFAGVNVLENDPKGRVGQGAPLPESLVSELRALGLPTALDKGQVSVVYPGYPQQDPGESDSAHRFRRNRDAAHVDGLLPIGEARRRHLREPHAYVLGIPVTETSHGASPLVVWEGSHLETHKNFKEELLRHPPETWKNVDLTDLYHAIRHKIFMNCPRVELTAQPGEAYLLHRLTLHGVAPWREGATAPPEGRVILYFRPEIGDLASWLSLD